MKLPTVLPSAGAITVANRIGVRSGTNSSRGEWAVSANRRRVSVARGASRRLLRGTGIAGAVSVAAIGTNSFVSGGPIESCPREPEVDVVERGGTGGERLGREAEPVDLGDRIS